MGNVVTLPDVLSRDEQIYRDRLSGLSLKAIARKYDVSESVALAAIDRCLTPLDAQMRKHTLQLELDRLDQMENVFHAKMMEGNEASASLMLRIKELRADYGGLRAPVRFDATQIITTEQPNTTQKIQRVLDEIAALPKPDNKPDIEEDE